MKEIPKTDAEREAAMSKAKIKKDNVPPADNVFTAENTNALDVQEPLFKGNRILVTGKESSYHDTVGHCAATISKIKIKASHGLQLVVFKVNEGDAGWDAAVLSYYGLNSKGTMPNMGTEEEIIQAANNFNNGETQRVAAGGTALADIKKVDILALIVTFNAERLARQEAEEALDDAMTVVAEERVVVDKLIQSMCGDIEHAARNLTGEAYKDFCKAWGMVFSNKVSYAYVNVRAEDMDTHAILVGVLLRIGLVAGTGGAKGVTNALGTSTLKSKNFEPTNLIGTLPMYDMGVMSITLVEGQTLTVILKMKKSPPLS